MEKLLALYERDDTQRGRPAIPTVKPACAWVEAGEGIATRKLDGMNVKVAEGVLFKRQKPAAGAYAEASYVPARRDNPTDRYLFEAVDATPAWPDGVYEAPGPKIQGNPERRDRHTLVRVVPYDPALMLADVPRTFEGLRAYLATQDLEGIVFHLPDGRKAKIKKRDFGLKR